MTGFLEKDPKGVPVTPVECCGMCLGEVVPPNGNCSRYNLCNGRGVCHSGFCECVDGYSGLDCSFRTATLKELFQNLAWELQVWGISGLIIGLWIFCCGRSSDSGRRRRTSTVVVGNRSGDEREEPLLDYVELIDTDSDSSEEMESSEDEETGNALNKGSSAPSAPMLLEGENQDSSCCSICMSSKGKHVVLVPCGHTGICKKCAKRVSFCPFCRAQICRRQKIFMPS